MPQDYPFPSHLPPRQYEAMGTKFVVSILPVWGEAIAIEAYFDFSLKRFYQGEAEYDLLRDYLDGVYAWRLLHVPADLALKDM